MTMRKALPKRRFGSSGQGRSHTTTVANDHHAHGFTAVIPIPMALSFIACAGAWIIFSQLQIASTEQAVLGLLQSGVQVTPGMIVPQVQAFKDGSLQHDSTIATAIAWAVQLQILIFSFPVHRMLLASHKQDSLPTSASITKSALSMAKAQKLLSILLIGADVVTDALYVLSGKTIGTGNIFGIIPLPSTAGWGILLISVAYPIAICSVTVFLGIQAVHRLNALWACLFPPKRDEEEI